MSTSCTNIRRSRLLAASLLGFSVAAIAWAGAAPGPARPSAEPVEAVARADQDSALAFTISGTVGKVLVQPGDKVVAAQPLVQLDDAESRVEVELLRLRASSDLEERAAKAEWDLAEVELEKWREMRSKDAANELQLRKATLEAERSKLAYELFVQRRREAELQVRQAEERLRRFTLVSPIAAVVDEVAVEAGEVVEPARAVVRVVDASALRIDASMPTSSTLGVKVGDPAWISVPLTSPPTVLKGIVKHVASVGDAGSETRLVRVQVTNTPGFPAGFGCKVQLTPPEAAK
ncbi:MAG: hypothetical protein RL689_1241 [Planctomycetota bacterium]